MGTPTVTPNVGLQVPAFGQANWQVPTNYNWNLLDSIFGGSVQIPGLNVVDLTVENLNSSVISSLVAALVQSGNLSPVGSSPASEWTGFGTFGILATIGVFVNGALQTPGTYTVGGSAIVTFQQPLAWSGAVAPTVLIVYIGSYVA